MFHPSEISARHSFSNSKADESDEDKLAVMTSFGICAMEMKVKSRPMIEILNRLKYFIHINVVIFPEQTILHSPVDQWPICQVFLSFYSRNFPIHKALEYANLRQPFLINDIEYQYVLMSRPKVYQLLAEAGIRIPRYIVMDRSDPEKMPTFVEHDDMIEIDGKIISKPFVEKPVDADNHDVYIYFPSTAGGGRQELFRKVGNKSSNYVFNNSVRTNGSFIYEEFMPTDGTDIKVYTVGEDYAHAEARKCPALDGKVERDSDGKEIRFPINLSPVEKAMAKKITTVFKQQICGFDLLRANGISYICDVNGFSFVKTSQKYFDDCGYILGSMIMRNLSPSMINSKMTKCISEKNRSYLMPTTSGTIMELRCIIAVIRHGDRTPKQKMKLEVRHPRFHQLFKKYSFDNQMELKLKKPSQLQEVLDIITSFLQEEEKSDQFSSEIEEKRNKFKQMRTVLQLYGHFSGINRKVQLKYKTSKNISDVSGSSRGMSLLLVLKWGGELTSYGRREAEILGRAFRCLYPGGTGRVGESAGQGLLRLHSTYRHDLKIYASDEGRVQMTAAAFAKGFLALEGEIPPILVQMVKSANTNGLLDYEKDSTQNKRLVKTKLFDILSQEKDLGSDDYKEIAPCCSKSLISALKCIENPVKACKKLMVYLTYYYDFLQILYRQKFDNIPLYHKESWQLLLRRWKKLKKDFRPKKQFDLSKIPDIYDNIKYDVQHNPLIVTPNQVIGFFKLAKCLADVIVPQEYGITKEEKLDIGGNICAPLLRKILSDARYSDADSFIRLHAEHSKGVASPERLVRTRLYFTSESHIQSLLNCIRFGELIDQTKDVQWRNSMNFVSVISELNYLSQIVIMIYENPLISEKNDSNRYHVELHFSPGEHFISKKILEFFHNSMKRNKWKDKYKLSRTSSLTDFTINEEDIKDDFCTVTPKLRKTKSENIFDRNDESTMKRQSSTYSSLLEMIKSSQRKSSFPLFSRPFKKKKSKNFENTKFYPNDVISKIEVENKNIFPLDVLHNNLTLAELETFLNRIIPTGTHNDNIGTSSQNL